MLSMRMLSVILILFGLAVNVKSQTCGSFGPYDSCSSNSACKCLRLSISDEIGVCALLGVSCSRLKPCQSADDTCEDQGHICVEYDRCGPGPRCYPLSMVDQRLCPPTIATTTAQTTAPTTAFQERTDYPTHMYHTMAVTTGRLTDGNIVTNYSDFLTLDSDVFPGRATFYQAIRILVNTTGAYSIISSSQMDTMGYLYRDNFYPENDLTNLIVSNDDYDGRNFGFVVELQQGLEYILVATTFSGNVTGPFSIVVRGPDNVELLPIGHVGQASTAIPTLDTTYSSNFSEFPEGPITSYYSNAITYANDKYPGSDRYYQAIRIAINTTGNYVFTSISGMDTVGHLYYGTFYPQSQQTNLVASNDDYNGSNQFKFLAYLVAGSEYTVVMTTFSMNVFGSFSLVVSGPDNIEFFPIRNGEEVTTASMFTTEFGSISSTFSSALTENSTMYTRSENASMTYCKEIYIRVKSSGAYKLKSVSNMDTYGALYQDNFILSDPSLNLLAENDDGAGNGQFVITNFLQANVKYILVVTTFSNLVTGSFSINAYGLDTLYFSE